MKILISTCNSYDFLIPGCVMLMNRYWPGQDITVLGFREIPGLPANVKVEVMAQEEKLPWSLYLRDWISANAPSEFVLCFDDYWLRAPVDQAKVEVLHKLVRERKIDKGDLTGNTHYFAHRDYPGGLYEATQDAQYRYSTQPAIFSKPYMLKALSDPAGRNPWQFELNLASINDGARIVGPKHDIFNYANVMLKGEPHGYMLCKLSDPDLEDLERMGALGGLMDIPTIRGHGPFIPPVSA